ncbi:hypothetical protein GCM10011581_08020 [Saccharopolyspora subtropica]|uniref:DUF1648 domain-containing protein n=1 Tax=Saccharopolyspora thermophila TaxID=89367 RepID=A0A917JJW3_9PSEU|nr:DUF1648 domain-containing protein [Saccharopolyspora subtropica]GGI73462.1 hypothetical protein GCM10011581_08020 [Saccharopolyspora subtropica]
MSHLVRFLVSAVCWVVAVTAALLLGVGVVRDRLPDPLATHWGFSGVPDGFQSRTGFLVVLLVGWLVIATIAVVCGVLGRRQRRTRAASAAVLGAAAVFVTGMAVAVVAANLDVADWTRARSLNWQPFAVLALAGAAGGIGWKLGNRGPDETPEAETSSPALALKATERTVWVSSVTSPVLLSIGGLTLLAALGSALLETPAAAMPLALAGVTCLALSSARVQIDERGVRTAFGPQRWPARRIHLDRITSARAEHRHALGAGGWGYRVLPASTAIMLRGGPCLVLRLTSGRDFVISVDHPERGAELVNALVTERSAL